MLANHCPPGVPIRQLNVTYVFSPLRLSELDSKAMEKSKNQVKLWEPHPQKKNVILRTHADSHVRPYVPSISPKGFHSDVVRPPSPY